MNRKPVRPPSALALILVSFVATTALVAGPALAHRAEALAAPPAR